MFFISTVLDRWNRQGPFSWKQPFRRRQLVNQIELKEEIRLQKHHLNAVNEHQKVKRNYFLERRTFL